MALFYPHDRSRVKIPWGSTTMRPWIEDRTCWACPQLQSQFRESSGWWTDVDRNFPWNDWKHAKSMQSYGMVFGFSMTFRLILLIFQVVISNNHPQYGNGWDKSFTLGEQLLDCKPCHSGSGIIPSYVAPNDLIPSHIEKNSHFQPGSCQTTWCSKWLPCGFVGKQVRTRFDPVL